MSTHTITAGHGYRYLTSQVAAQDASVVQPGGLGAYYSERGESPGQWLGSGLAGVGLVVGDLVREDQMIALFGDGRHPESVRIAQHLRREGAGEDVIDVATQLGTPFASNLANSEFQRQVGQLIAEWNRAHDQADCASVPPHIKARIRTAVGQALFAQAHGHEPDERELADFIAQQSRLGSKAVAGFDLTFSPVKSVSALWALAPLPVAREIEAAHRAAVTDTIAWLEEAATFTRLGRNGVRQVETRGLVAAAFVHRCSRAGDPDLHTHVAISNKVQTLDGQWRALDGRVLFKATVAASELYNTMLEAHLRDRLGVEFVEVERPGRRPVREIDGMDPRLLEMWSQRRAVIDTRRAELTASFQAEHGRPPTPPEAIELAQQATLETRPAKHDPRSEEEQRGFWRRQAEALLPGSQLVTTLDKILRRGGCGTQFDPEQAREVAQQVIDRVQADRATWQCWHVIAEARRVVRHLSVSARDVRPAVSAIVAAALEDYSIALPRPDVVTPEALQRSDGTSVYSVAGSLLYTSRAVLDAEQSLLAAAQRFDGAGVREAAIEMALLEATANELILNKGQVAFVRELAGSGARLQLALAPAGTGKTTGLRVLSQAWRGDGGDVVALAPSAAAARLLGDALGTPAETLAKALLQLDQGTGLMGSRTLVLVDEAGMASTPDLARLVGHAMRAGASVRLVGDDRQLAAIGAGGILRDLAETTDAVTLDDAIRFVAPQEAAAALRIRDGDRQAFMFYLLYQRVHVGDEHTTATSAYEAWAVDRAAGSDALLLAATRDQVIALNARARADRLASLGVPVGREAPLADGNRVSAGDEIVTRHNDRRLQITATDWVKNGDRWTVRSVHDDGTLTAIHRDTGRHVTLPARYVADHVALGYAVTIHGAQGSTAETCHTVVTGRESREQLYVALSRGRSANHLHVVLPGAADEHAPIRRETLQPPTALDVLTRILDRESAQVSATSAQRRLDNPTGRLREAVDRYLDSLSQTPAAEPAWLSPAPLPWLPPVPVFGNERWDEYFDARARQIAKLADQIVDHVTGTQTPSAALNLRDWYYQSHLALWRATHADPPQRLSPREEAYQQHLDARYENASYDDAMPRWLSLIKAVDPDAATAPEWPELAEALTQAFHWRIDVDRLVPKLLIHREYAAAIETLNRLVDERADERRRAAAAEARARVAHQHASLGYRSIEPPSMSRDIGL